MLTYGYLIGPMKMRSLRHTLKMLPASWTPNLHQKEVKIFPYRYFGVCRSKGCKMTVLQTLRMVWIRSESNLGGLVRVGQGQETDFFLELLLWKLVTLLPFDLQTPKYIICVERSKSLWKIYLQFNRLVGFLGSILLSQSDFISIGLIY